MKSFGPSIFNFGLLVFFNWDSLFMDRDSWFFTRRFPGRTISICNKVTANPSLRRICNLTLVSNVCEAAPISLFWAPKGLLDLPEMRFEFSFNLIGKSTMAFLTSQSWRVLKSWTRAGAQNKDFAADSQTDLTRV